MITEDYVSFEVAKLLKEKGFDEPCFAYYNLFYDSEGKEMKLWRKFPHRMQPNSDYLNVPTNQMAMKWLREVHNIYIDISPTYSEVEKTMHFIWQVFDSNYDGIGDCEMFYGKYEQACEEAIKYCLENLI